MILADATAYDAGRITGQLVAVLVLLLGVLKCWTISRRSATNAKCVLALMLLLLGWLVAAVASMLLGRNPDLRVVYGLFGLAMLGLILAALVLAILGLAEYANARERYTQGRAQAIWALVLCGVFGCFAVAGVLRGAMRSAASSRQPAAGTRLEFQDVNFRFTAPGRPWAQAEAKKLSPYAKLAFLRGSPEMYFMVTADPCLDADCATERLAEMSATRMQTLSDNFRPVSRAPLRVGGLDGLRVENQTEQRALAIHYVHWFCATNGWAYHLMAWGNVQHRQAITAEAGRLLQRFEMIDYARRPPLIGKPTVADFVSTNFPYVVRCGTPDWLGWDKIDTECQYASFGVLHRQGAALAVAAVQLPASQPRPELVYRGLLEMMGFGQSAADLSNAREIHEKHLVGIEIKLHRTTESGTEFSYQIKVLQGGGFAFLVAAWVDSRHEQTEKFLADAVSRVEFLEPPASAPDLALLSEREKRAERLACNQIGLVAYREGQYDLASQFFKMAVGQGGPLKTTPYLANLTVFSGGARRPGGPGGDELRPPVRHRLQHGRPFSRVRRPAGDGASAGEGARRD